MVVTKPMKGLSVAERATMTPGRPPGPTADGNQRHRRGNRPAATASHRNAVALANPTPKVRLPEVIVGVLLVAGSALAAMVWHSSNSTTTPALVLAIDVERGHVFEQADFAAAEVKSTGVRLRKFEDRADLIGRIAAVDLQAADPVTDAVAVTLLPIGPDKALVSRRLEAGQFPDSITPGSTVRVVIVNPVETTDTPTSAADANPAVAAPAATPALAKVEDVRPGESAADTVIITLQLPNATADSVASAKEIRLVQVNG